MRVEGYRLHQWGNELRWESFDIPEPGPGEVLVRVEACSIGLTVLNCIRGDLADDHDLLPRVPGHELVGRITSVGGDTHTLQGGQRVMAYFYLSCGACQPCRSGADSLCENLAGWVGVHKDGGYASHTILPTQNVLPLPETIPPVMATAIPDAIATSLHVCKTRAQVRPGDRVVVIGAGGGVGAHMLQMAALYGGDVVGLEIDEAKFPIIEQAGAIPLLSDSFAELDPATFWNGKKPSVIIDLVGSQASLAWGLEALAAGGRIVVLTTFRDVDFPVEPRALVFREISVLGSRYASKAELLEAAKLVETNRIKPVVTRIAAPEDVEKVHQELRAGTLIGRGALDWTESH